MGKPASPAHGARRGAWGGVLAPEDWPAWVLWFEHGTTGPQSPVNADFHVWQARRLAWVLEHRPDMVRRFFGRELVGPFLAAANRERRRRGRAALWIRAGGRPPGTAY